ncbi:magnesium-translocating P-type ATPase [Oscillospiraceae bacterium MB08-C2-2]|nr:magnesium-translocating P-type ATPase [Oscillospiraceae bacterium MB08-C2-2]
MKNNKRLNDRLRQEIEQALTEASRLEEKALFARYEATAEGFSTLQAEELLEDKGTNTIAQEAPRPWAVRLLLAFANSFNFVLMAVAAVSFVTEVWLVSPESRSWATVLIIVALILVSGLLQFFQEEKSDGAARRLKEMVSSNTSVLRDGRFQEIPMAQLVPGDVVSLSAGDMIPADLRVLTAKDLFISQAALTGESEPVEKFSEAPDQEHSFMEIPNIAFMGTNVISGAATALVAGTGDNTYFGTIAHSLAGQRAATSFEKGIADVSRVLLRLMLLMVPIILVVNGVTKKDWLGALLFAMSVAVGITPQLLPVIMTSTLAKGALAMSKHKTIVKNLPAIQTFGAMDVLCTDKTGTLTEDRIVLERYLDIHGNEDQRILRHAYLNSYFQTGLKNLIDLAIIERSNRQGAEQWRQEYTKEDEIPFDFNRRRMSVVLRDGTGKRQLITKGAVEEMLDICAFTEYQGEVTPLTLEHRERVLALSDSLNEQGLRVLAIAQKNHVSDVETFGVADESEMVLIGFVGFLDPPKESAKKALAALSEHGVRAIVLTGDNEKVARTVCRHLNMQVDRYLMGDDVAAMTDEALSASLDEVNLYAKLSPAQKSRVVRLLQQKGHTVGYMGDGINDAPALRQADIGISVDSAVDIAKESADIILLEKSLMVLEQGVLEGRQTFGNLVKYIKMAVSGNFGNMFSVLIASVALPFLPMLPIQILAQNLLYDFSQMAIPFDRMDPQYILHPRKWDARDIQRFMYCLGPVSSLMDILTFVVLYFVFGFNTPEKAVFFQTGWFMMGLLSQTLVVHQIRTAGLPFTQSRASAALTVSTFAVGILALVIPYTFIGTALDMHPVSFTFFPWLLALMLLYFALVQVVKNWYIRRYGNWI